MVVLLSIIYNLNVKGESKMRKFFRFLMLTICIIIVLRGVGDIALFVFGEKTSAQINYSTRSFSGRASRPIYIGHYTFSPSDNSLRTGSVLIGKDLSSGFIPVRYFSFYPEFNSADTPLLLFWGVCWCVIGIIIMIFNIRGLKRLSLLEARAKRIFKSRDERTLDVGTKEIQGRSIRLGYTVIIIAIAAAGFSTWYFFRGYVSSVSTDSVSDSSRGNSSGNISNEGMFAELNNTIYFINTKDNYKIYSMKEDGTLLKKITDDSVKYINSSEGYIYYSSFSDGDKIYRIKTDGSKKQRIYKWKSSYINLVGQWLYLSNGNDHSKLYKVMVNGSSEKQLNNDETEYINVGGGWIYYSNKTDNSCIYRIKTDGTGRQKINEVSSIDLILDGDYIYFINMEDSKKIYRIKTDGTGMKKINGTETGSMNISGNTLYYNNMEDGGFLYSISLSDKTVKKLNDIDSWFISILKDNIYYTESWDTGKIYRLTMDGEHNNLILK